MEWDSEAVTGVSRWLHRVWNLVHRYVPHAESSDETLGGKALYSTQELLLKTNETIQRVELAFR